MRILFNFKCEDGHVTEQLVNNDVHTGTCRTCDKPASRMVSTPRIRLEGISGSFPDASAKWEKIRSKHLAYENKAIENHGPDAAWDIARR